MSNPTNPVIDSIGAKRWYNSDGLLHREDGPAVEHRLNGAKLWYINGLLHRDNGPAVQWMDGSTAWFIRDKNISDKVEQWIMDNNFPEYEQWNDSIKVMFKLKFG